jgi:LmbE family N-acetylglucosaminyl deacetylase
MQSLIFNNESGTPLRILCLGAHSDDIEIGCGGTILKLMQDQPELNVHWVVFGATNKRLEEAHTSAQEFLAPAKEKKVVIQDFKDSFFPSIKYEIKHYFETLKQEVDPDIIFTHCQNDAHQDHRVINELTWNTFRNHLIFEYEIPKYDGDLGIPNLFVGLNEATCKAKISLLMKHFKSQAERDWFTEDLFLALLRLRGVESRSRYRYAEAFYCRKMVL